MESEHFYLPLNGSERNSESFMFRGTAGIPSELTICSVYTVFRGIIFLAETANSSRVCQPAADSNRSLAHIFWNLNLLG